QPGEEPSARRPATLHELQHFAAARTPPPAAARLVVDVELIDDLPYAGHPSHAPYELIEVVGQHRAPQGHATVDHHRLDGAGATDDGADPRPHSLVQHAVAHLAGGQAAAQLGHHPPRAVAHVARGGADGIAGAVGRADEPVAHAGPPAPTAGGVEQVHEAGAG